MASLLSDFLSELCVRHTEDYSDRRFREMPFSSLFGLSSLLKEYRVGTVGVTVADSTKLEALGCFPVPFLADTADGFIIVKRVDGDNVTYLSQQKEFAAPLREVAAGWNGVALLAESDSDSVEPDYSRHHLAELAGVVKTWIFRVLVAVLVMFGMWWGGLWRDLSAWLLLAFDCAGIWLSWMLLQKSLGVRNSAAEAVCSVMEEGGCDELARSEASSFMGIFKWSEVGMAYFSVSLLSMLLFPSALPALAACNILCLPYTVWSITYQKFKAKVWCTLCVCVQATLWLLFGAYLLGGWTGSIFPVSSSGMICFLTLGVCYVVVLLGLNRIDNAIIRHFKPKEDENT